MEIAAEMRADRLLYNLIIRTMEVKNEISIINYSGSFC